MEEKIKEFKELWSRNYSYISLELTDDAIAEFIEDNNSIAMAANYAADYLLASGNADVQE